MAHELARAIRCPAICRDEIKEGMVHATGSFEASPGDPHTLRTLPLFFAVLRVLLEGGVTVVAEAAFQDKVWTPNLKRLAHVANLRIVQCHTDPDVVTRRDWRVARSWRYRFSSGTGSAVSRKCRAES